MSLPNREFKNQTNQRNLLTPKALVRAMPYSGRGLQVAFDTRDGPVFEIAAFHQLHCLTAILRDFGRMRFGVPLQTLQQGFEVITWEEHIAHCFDYIRETLMCFADSTAEGHMPNAPDRVALSGVQHVCNDFNGLVEWTSAPERGQPKSVAGVE